jgi:hypothetical protein
MTVIQLNTGGLLLYSPILLTPLLAEELRALGSVRFVVSPDTWHHLFVADYIV